jgi:hypothetical protein
MSRESSTIETTKCDIIDCEKQLIHIQGQRFSKDRDEEWGQITLNGDREFDLCPDHLRQFEDFMYGPDDFASAQGS